MELKRKVSCAVALRCVERRVGDEHRFGAEDRLHFAQAIRNERPARRDDVEDGVRNTYRRCDLHRSFDDVNLRFNALLRKVCAQDIGIGGRYAPPVEVAGTRVVGCIGYGEREAAGAESELHHPFDREAFFGHFVLADDAQIGDAHRDGLRDVVVAQKEYFERKSLGTSDEPAFAVRDADAGFEEQAEALFVEPAFGLNGYS